MKNLSTINVCNREQKLIEAVKKNLSYGKEVKYDEIGDFIEDDKYIDLFLQCVDQFGYTEYQMLSVFENTHCSSKKQYIFLREGLDDTIDFCDYVEENDTPFSYIGEFSYIFAYADEDREYEYELEFEQYA